MIRPLMPFRIKGAIWYQGENNVGDGYWYRYKLAAMIRSWREQWGIGEFPFYIAQLAGNGRHRPDEPCERGGWAEFRDRFLIHHRNWLTSTSPTECSMS
ncbi:sialate O-acetylesterase [Planctomycetota bacterium]